MYVESVCGLAMVKNLYKGVFDYPHTAFTIRRMAYSPEQARILIARAVANKQGVDVADVLVWMKENPERYLIKLEIEWSEEDDRGVQV